MKTFFLLPGILSAMITSAQKTKGTYEYYLDKSKHHKRQATSSQLILIFAAGQNIFLSRVYRVDKTYQPSLTLRIDL